MKKSLLFCLGLVFISLFAAVAEEPRNAAEPLPGVSRVACVGDSITFGVGTGGGHSYPAQLQELLGEKWAVGKFGVSGTTILHKGDYPYWRTKDFTKAQAFLPNIVIIMLGTNDTKPQNWIHQDEFIADYTEMVKLFLDLPSKPQIFICRPTPVPEPGLAGINETNILEEIKMLDQLAEKLPVKIIDMHAALLDQPALLPDHVHPSTAGAAAMAKAAFTALTAKENAPGEKNSLGVPLHMTKP